MGTWGASNFQDDHALDWLARAVTEPLVATIESGLRGQDEANDHVITAAAEVLAVVCENLNTYPPEPSRIAGWRDSYLRAWDSYIDGLDPKPEYKEVRRTVIVETFNRLLKVAKRWHAVALRVEFDEAIPPAERVRLQEQLHAALAVVEVGEVTGGVTLDVPGENGELTAITGAAFSRDAAVAALRRILQELNVRSAMWISLGDPVDESAEVWVELD
jgi:hypothetical protein